MKGDTTMNKTVTAEAMLTYLKDDWKIAHHQLEVLGHDDERAQSRVDWCIGMKEMCEALLCVPVNLKLDGRLTIGYEPEVEI